MGTSLFLRLHLVILLVFSVEIISAANPNASGDMESMQMLKKANEFVAKGSEKNVFALTSELIDRDIDDVENYQYYMSAVKLWEKALAADSNNSNLNYKTGLCYFFSYDEQLKALPYFIKAVKNMRNDYDFKDINEKKAPYSALYFLAETYLEYGQADSAINYFTLYQDKHVAHPISTDKGLSNSINYKIRQKRPVQFMAKNLGEMINSKYAETNPVVNTKNNLLFFSSRRPSGVKNIDRKNNGMHYLNNADIYFSTKDSLGQWSDPQSFKFNTPFDEQPLYISMDGLTLFFRRTTNGNTDIFTSNFVNGAWIKPEPLTEINTKFNETGLCLTADGKTMYFASDRNKSGKSDIYTSKLQPDGTWGPVGRLKTNINTSFNELSPFISGDGKTLYFETNGSSNAGLGGYDIFKSDLIGENTWSDPQNIGYPINQSRTEINYYLVEGDKPGDNPHKYFSKLTTNNSYDLFEVVPTPTLSDSITDVLVSNNMVPDRLKGLLGSALWAKVKEELLPRIKAELRDELRKELKDEIQAEMNASAASTGKVDTVFIVKQVMARPKGIDGLPARVNPVTENQDKSPVDKQDKQQEVSQEKGNQVAEKKEMQKPLQQRNADPVTVKLSDLKLETVSPSDKAVIASKINEYLAEQLKTSEAVRFKVVYFNSNQYALNETALNDLKSLLEFLKAHPQQKIELDGHADGLGKWEENLQLSAYRVRQVYNYLLANHIGYNRMIITSKGSAVPVASNETDQERSKNRRVEVYLLK